MGIFKDLTGTTIGRWKVVERVESRGGISRYLCTCECGNSRVVFANQLNNGNSRSCGCLHKEIVGEAARKHGMSRTRTYRIWAGMLDRCLNSHRREYPRYGGRGISVCDEWRTFPAFLKDMGLAPSGMTLDRIDNDGHYEPSNCKWETRKGQSNNMVNTLRFEDGGQLKTISQLSVELGLSRRQVYWIYVRR